MTVKELVADLLYCNADSNVVLEDDVEFTDEYGKVSGSCYQIEKVVKHGRSVSLHFDNRHHFIREQEPKTGHWVRVNVAKLKCSVCGEIDCRMTIADKYCPNCGAKMECEEE